MVESKTDRYIAQLIFQVLKKKLSGCCVKEIEPIGELKEANLKISTIEVECTPRWQQEEKGRLLPVPVNPVAELLRRTHKIKTENHNRKQVIKLKYMTLPILVHCTLPKNFTAESIESKNTTNHDQPNKTSNYAIN